MKLLNLNATIGFILPLPIFIELGSPLLLATSKLAEGGLALPLSFFLLPPVLVFAFIANVSRIHRMHTECFVFCSLFSMFAIWSTFLAFFSSAISTTSFSYAYQWCMPFLWFFYFVTLDDTEKNATFLHSFFYGALSGSAYTCLAGVLEICLHGGLQDMGRMTQNLILPGHYQLYVYVPTVIAYASLLSIAAASSKVISINRILVKMLFVFSLLALLFTGSREGVLVFLLGLTGLFFVRNRRLIFPSVIALVMLTSVLYVNRDHLFQFAEDSGLRFLAKVAALREADRMYGGRDEMIAAYTNIIRRDPFGGLAMLPPSVTLPETGILAPSAHNYYIDTFAWGGIINISVIGALVLFLFVKGCLIIAKFSPAEECKNSFTLSICFLLFLYLAVSNNINVPLRQPLTGPICVFFMYWVLSGHRSLSDQQLKRFS